MAEFGEPVIDIELRAGQLEGVGAEDLAGPDRSADFGGGWALVSGRGEVGPVVGQHRVQRVRDDFDQPPQEFGGGSTADALMQFDGGELARAVDSHGHQELALFGPDLGSIDVEVADRIGLKGLASDLVAVDRRQAGDVVPLKQAI